MLLALLGRSRQNEFDVALDVSGVRKRPGKIKTFAFGSAMRT
ncbi:hypothetical protein [Bradyrhizobium sp. 192]|nr:hypothetical protein [Bradyrhizobium sp. 192]